MTTFAAAVSLERVGNEYSHQLDPSRANLLGTLYGGYIMALALQAMAIETPDRAMLSATCQFTRALPAGEARVAVEDVRVGRNVATKTAQLRVGDRVGVHATALFGPTPQSPAVWNEDPPELPPLAECADPFANTGASLAFTWPALVLTPPSLVEVVRAGSAKRPEAFAWSGFEDDEALTGPRMAMLADRFVPPPWLMGRFVAMRTLQLSFHLHRPGHIGWMKTRFFTPTISDELVTLESTYWSQSGDVVATARQLAQPIEIDATL